MAPAASKFEILVSHRSCSTLYHPETPGSCSAGLFLMLKSAVPGTVGSSLLFYLIKMLLRGPENMRIEDWQQLPSKTLRTSIAALSLAGGSLATMCFLRRILGRFYVSTLIFIPGVVGGLAIFLEDPRNRSPYIASFFLWVTEFLVSKLVEKTGSEFTVVRQTGFFCLVNALLLFMQRTDTSGERVLWFYWPKDGHSSQLLESETSRQPQATPVDCRQEHLSCKRHELQDQDQNKCTPSLECVHSRACLKHASQGALKYLALGSALTLARVILPTVRSFMGIPKDTLNSHQVPSLLSLCRFPAFFATYAGLFRLTRCALTRFFREDVPAHSAAAGLVSGLTYLISPSLSVLSAAIASILQLVWRRARSTGVLGSSPELLFACCVGVLMHARCFDPALIPKIASLVLAGFSGGKSDEVSTNFKHLIINGLKEQI